MKKFTRTLTGKIILFIMCIFFACTCLLSLSGIIYMFEKDYYVYSKTYICDNIEVEYFIDYGEKILQKHYLPDSYTGANFTPQNSIHYIAKDGTGKIIELSANAHDASSSKWKYKFHYRIFKSEDYDFVTDICNVNETVPYDFRSYNTVYIDPANYLTEESDLSHIINTTSVIYDLRYAAFAVVTVSLILCFVCFIILMRVAGRKPDSDDVIPGPFNIIPFDIMMAASFTIICILFCIITYIECRITVNFLIALIISAILISIIIGLCLCLSFSTRVKTKTLIKNTVLFRICKLLKNILCIFFLRLKKYTVICLELIRNIPLIWRTALIISALTVSEFIAILVCQHEIDNLLGLWFTEKLILIPAILFLALSLRKLQKGGFALANGDLNYTTDTSKMFWDFKQHGENLNSIAKGMSIAVEDRIKSERMKTELITNVSHDIKTPLTSIINYTNLIANEDCDNEKINQYTEVLTRQSDRLKRLIDDLVEASKASTGNLDVNLVPCDAAVFISQVDGEYDEKLKKANLTLITKQPDKPVLIMADGRRMWRIFDNLMNNICKYAQPGTRVYLSLETKDNNAIITFKNISKDEMNISEDDLMERFVRGDSSRNTEGNGLGLSIAKSMATLQNGMLTINIDGDLFKSILTFPITG